MDKNSGTNEIWVVGWPKSGNTWVARLLGDILDSPIRSGSLADEGFDRKGDYLIRQYHMVYTEYHENMGRIVLVVRDPRDVAVSMMYYWQRKSIEEIVRGMIGQEKGIFSKGGTWASYYMNWIRLLEHPVYVRYEDLILYPELALIELLARHELKPVKSVTEVISRQSFWSRVKIAQEHGNDLNYGKEIQLRLLRMGVNGDWRNHFDERLNNMALEHFGEVMEWFDYLE